jgi:AcrR family transcriptional regulator
MDGSVATRKAGVPRSGIAERIWDAARTEFSKRGYHGARVQGIARGASCNVALIYRHWASKRALYLDILRAVWLGSANEIARLVQSGPGGAASVVAAYLDAMMNDPMGSQILIREYLDGAPFLSQLTQTDPALLEPVRRAAHALRDGGADTGIDPVLAVVTVGGLAALVASSREAARPFVQEPLAPEAWRRHVLDLLVNGLAPPRPSPAPNGPASPGGSSTSSTDV